MYHIEHLYRRQKPTLDWLDASSAIGVSTMHLYNCKNAQCLNVYMFTNNQMKKDKFFPVIKIVDRAKSRAPLVGGGGIHTRILFIVNIISESFTLRKHCHIKPKNVL